MVLKSKRPEVSELQGFKYFSMISDLLPRLQNIGTERDKSQNRELFCDQYLSLLIFYFFNPVLTSLDSLQQASELDKVQKMLGVKRVSMGSLSEAGSVFDPAPVAAIIQELAAKAVPLSKGREAEVLRGLTAVDGSIFQAASRAAWALWQDQRHRAVNLHLHFAVFEGVPRSATVTPRRLLGTRAAQGLARSEPHLCHGSRLSGLWAASGHPGCGLVLHWPRQGQHRLRRRRGT